MNLLERPLRAAILAAAESPAVRRVVQRHGMRLGARRFVAGTTEREFLDAAKAANARGFAVACGILGEGVRDAAAASAIARTYESLLRTFADEGIDANVAFKPSHVGLDVDPELAFENAAVIAEAASQTGNTVRLDMEQSSYVGATLELYRRLHARYPCVGFVLQSYLYRSLDDLRAALPLRPNVRLVKGAYLEPAGVAYSRKADVDANYLRLVELALAYPGYTAIATHDARIVDAVERIACERALPLRGRFEFQLLYGIGAPLAERLLAKGYRVRLAIPYGEAWFPYLMRRLAERPANLTFFLKGALARR